MKRLISIIISTVLILSIAVIPVYAESETITSQDTLYDYRMINESEIEIVKFNGLDEYGTENTYTIPSQIDGYTVRWLGEYAFTNYEGLEYKQTPRIRATTIIIPDTVTFIDDYAFASSHWEDWSLMSLRAQHIVIPDSVVCIGDYAFNECEHLKNVTVPDSVRKIGKGAFRGCFSLETAELGNGIKEIPDELFNCCKKLKTLKMNPNQTKIGDSAFFNCLDLNSLTINMQTELGKYAYGYDHYDQWDDAEDECLYYPHHTPTNERRPGKAKLIIKLDNEKKYIILYDTKEYAKECSMPLYLRIDDESFSGDLSEEAGTQAKILYKGKTVKGWKSSNSKAVKITDSGKFGFYCAGKANLTCKLDSGKTLTVAVSSSDPSFLEYSIKYSDKKPSLTYKYTYNPVKVKKGKSVKLYIDGRIPNTKITVKTTKHIKVTASTKTDTIKITGKKKGLGTAKITVNGKTIKLKVKVS